MDPQPKRTEWLPPRRPPSTPWPEAWRREIYERVVPAAWALVTGPVVAHGADGRAYMFWELHRRFGPVSRHMANAVVPVEDQARFVQAFRTRRGKGPPAAEWRVHSGATRRAFSAALEWTLFFAFFEENDYDIALGVPRSLRCHPLTFRNGTGVWAKHVAARRGDHGDEKAKTRLHDKEDNIA